MIRIYHNDLTLERWQKFSFFEQMANIGSEVFRAMSWRQKNREYSRLALERALELLDLTLEAVAASGSRLRELTRLREALVDYFILELLITLQEIRPPKYRLLDQSIWLFNLTLIPFIATLTPDSY
jgi:hypothetical protein